MYPRKHSKYAWLVLTASVAFAGCGDKPVTQEQALERQMQLDAIGDFIDSISSSVVTWKHPSFDMESFDGYREDLNDAEADERFSGPDARFACGQHADRLVLCSHPNAQWVGGDYLFFEMKMHGDLVLNDPNHRFIYTAALDADGKSDNNWRVHDPFDWDTYQGTDTWITAAWDRSVWQVDVMEVTTSQQIVPSAIPTRIALDVEGGRLSIAIPADFIKDPAPGYRLTTYSDDDNYNPDHRGADVSGDNPTNPLFRSKVVF